MQPELYDTRTDYRIKTLMDIGNIKSLQNQCDKDKRVCRERACDMMVKIVRSSIITKIRVCDIRIEDE